MEYAEILHRCFRCGYCKLPGNYQDLNCPSYLNYRFETFSPGGRLWLLRGWLNGEIQTTPRLAEILYSCATCGNCVAHCVFDKFRDHLVQAFLAGREALVDQGLVPPPVRDTLKSLQLYGNPYKQPEAARGDWADGLGLAPYSGQEFLFLSGCVGAFDELGQKMARAAAALLRAWGVEFGILGADEPCDGSEIRDLGEKGLFQNLAERNIQKFRGREVKRIITLSPHAYHVLKEEYPLLGETFEVYHYSQILARLARQAQPKPLTSPKRVAFHDPCFLGRYQKEYQAPRKFLGAIPGLELIELDRARADALCCGGGGGNFFTEILGRGPDSPARVRVREAAAAGAEILVVACPQCASMLDT
ncbi:MAG: (Fe-S)-binding protein, partial [Desulfobacterota bacterium]|nr:(Fe-S)-binding protein [Thermodesulfobacteriota bacterium]